MGFDERRMPKVSRPMTETDLRVTDVREPSDVVVTELPAGELRPRTLRLDEIASERGFQPHAGWAGHMERQSR